MDKNEEMYVNELTEQYKSAQLRSMQLENQYAQSSDYPTKTDQGLIEYQLDLKEELDRINHLLSGHIMLKDNYGNEDWQEPNDNRLKVFSDYGVKRLMNIIQFYINRNTLLSNYDELTIKWKVRDFGIELADFIFTQYENIFYYPSQEELFEKYSIIVKEYNLNIDDKTLYKKCGEWSKIELQYRIRHYSIIVLALVDTVHSTYLRALGGEERDSLRKNWHIHENPSLQYQQPPQKFSLFKPSSWSGNK